MAFTVRKDVVGSIIRCTLISSRLISIRISARPHNITVIRVYAQTLGQEDEEVEQFYAHIDSMIPKTPRKDILAVLGDWNAKVGPDAYQHWAGTVGKFGIEELDDRGWRLLKFAKSHRLTLASILHPTSCLGQQPGMPLMGSFTTKYRLHSDTPTLHVQRQQS